MAIAHSASARVAAHLETVTGQKSRCGKLLWTYLHSYFHVLCFEQQKRAQKHLFVGRLSRELWAKERPQLWMAKLGGFWAT
jgi:hypothetical protein